MKTSSLIASSLVAAWQIFGALAQDSGSACSVSPPKQSPSSFPVPGSPISQGCYKSAGNMTEADIDSTGVSSGSCREYCIENSFWLFALHGSKCLCGFAMPSADDLAEDDDCNYPCPAFCPEACGSLGNPGYYSVFNLGEEMDPPVYEDEEATTTSSSMPVETTEASDDSDEAEQSAVTSAPPEETSTEPEEDSGPNVGGIVAGVVVGVVVLLGAAGGLFFYMRRKRNSEIEEEHRRNAAVNAFISGSKPPGSSGSISMTDSRLDPIMAHRRLSDGSIADNEDYSRKILRVTNA